MTRLRPRGEHLLAGGAFVLGCARGSGSPMTCDAGYHLLRAGNELLTGSLNAYRTSPGGEHAPLLGAGVTAFGALFAPGGGEAAQLVPGCALLGAAAALVLLSLARRVERAAVVLGLALLLLPAAVVSSFTYRPDAALAGVLLLVAIDRQGRSGSALSVTVPAWLAVLAAPWALPAAIVLQLANAKVPRAWIAPGLTIVGVAALSLDLGDGAREQILRGLFGEVAFGVGARETLDVLRRVWGGGILLAVPLVLPLFVRGTGIPRAAYLAFVASAVFLLVGSQPGAFRAGAAALLPVAALFGARVADAFPDPRGRGTPHRPVLFALLLPLLLLLLGGAEDTAERRAVRGPASREAQIALFLHDEWSDPGDVQASRTGALGALSGRLVRVLPEGGTPGAPLPSLIVLGDGLRPLGADEHTLFEHPVFLARYAPLEFRRGRTNEILDCVWVRVDEVESVRPEYARALLEAWEAQDRGEDEIARLALESATGLEPKGRGLVSEALGLLQERLGHPDEAERAFRTAREKDQFAVRARGHLIDLALARGGILSADSLVFEAARFNPHLAEVIAERARLFARAGHLQEAASESEHAARLWPASGRIMANWGVYLWRSGSFEAAREAWQHAIHREPWILHYLGDFERAADSIPAPPPLPLFTDDEFEPLTWRTSGDTSAAAP